MGIDEQLEAAFESFMVRNGYDAIKSLTIMPKAEKAWRWLLFQAHCDGASWALRGVKKTFKEPKPETVTV